MVYTVLTARNSTNMDDTKRYAFSINLIDEDKELEDYALCYTTADAMLQDMYLRVEQCGWRTFLYWHVYEQRKWLFWKYWTYLGCGLDVFVIDKYLFGKMFSGQIPRNEHVFWWRGGAPICADCVPTDESGDYPWDSQLLDYWVKNRPEKIADVCQQCHRAFRPVSTVTRKKG